MALDGDPGAPVNEPAAKRKMSRTTAGALIAGLVACLVLQTGAVWWESGAAGLGSPLWWIPAAVALGLSFLLRNRVRGLRRAALLLAVATQILLIVLAYAGGRTVGGDDAEWSTRRREALADRADHLAGTVPRLEATLDTLSRRADRLPADMPPFDLLDNILASWSRSADPVDRNVFSLGLTLWRGGERLAWTDGARPFPAVGRSQDDEQGWGLVQEGDDGWYWRRFRPLRLRPGGEVVEYQLRLADPVSDPAVPPAGWYLSGAVGGSRIRTEVLVGTRGVAGMWQGDARRGLIFSVADPLRGATPAGDPAVLRLSLDAPPRALQAQRRSDRFEIIRLLLLALCAFGLGGAFGPWWILPVIAWAVRWVWVAAALCHRLLPAFSGPRSPPGPGDPASLVDPAYFASQWGGGLYASTADALITGALVALTAWFLIRILSAAAPIPEKGAARTGGFLRQMLFGLAFAAGAAILLLPLHDLVGEIVANANARLIGPKVPFTVLPFWGLHLTLLLHAGAAAVLLVDLARRLRRRIAGNAGLAVFFGSLVLTVLLGSHLTPVSHILLPVLVLLLWRSAGFFPRRARPLKRFAVLLPLLAVLAWNYIALNSAYGRAEMIWLESRAEEIARPQDDWVRFLMEDLLAELAVLEPFPSPVAGAHAAVAADLWRDWRAYELWRTTGIDQLDLPCQIEVLNPDGDVTSLFASGFFRDQGYELGERSAWEEAEPAVPRPGARQAISIQSERRRYPDGDEWILRGEVARPGGEGWVRLELPVRSRRIATLRERLVGSDSAGSDGGYLPRREVDRPLLLLRGGPGGWLDAGGGPVPGDEILPVLSDLRKGLVEDVMITVEGRRYRCLWRASDEEGAGFLIGLENPGLTYRVLDLSRLILLDLMLLAGLLALPLLVRSLRRDRSLNLGFQERFLVVYMILGLVPLLLAGAFVNRLSRDLLAEGARSETREGLEAASKQIQGLLAEQGRALAASDYISDLLDSRLEGRRPLGPYGARQGMLFAADGTLLLDETLSDLDPIEAEMLLRQARKSPLVLMQDDMGVWLGTAVPVTLSGILAADPATSAADSVGAELHEAPSSNGLFFYRQRVEGGLLPGLGEVIQGEMTLHVAGEALYASHPERVFSGAGFLMLPPGVMTRLQRQPGNTSLHRLPGSDLAWTGILAMPTLENVGGRLSLREVPAALAVTFPAREREYSAQREQIILFLAGLATLIFLTASFLALALTWRIFDPVRVLVAATRRLASGDFDAPLPDEGLDELGTLSASFRGMRDDLRDAQRTLAERERFLSSLLEKVPVGVAVYADDQDVVSLNPAARRIIDAFYDGADLGTEARPPRLLAEFRDAATGGEAAAEVRAWDGRLTLRGRIAPLDLPGGRRDTMLVFEDVTEFLANKRLALNAQLARQVAHEVKNPLTPIQLSVQFLQQAWRDRAEDMDGILESTVGQVLEQVSLLRSIATEFSLLGRPERLECQSLDWPGLAARVCGRYRQGDDEAAAGPRVRWEEAEVPAVLAHAESLEKVLGNLMENSIQAVGDPAALEVVVGWRIDDREVTLLWRDNGPGLDSEVADRLFNLYFSTKSQGTGLGLSICRNLLEKMNGRISLRNRGDRSGAVAEVVLPRADAAPPAD